MEENNDEQSIGRSRTSNPRSDIGTLVARQDDGHDRNDDRATFHCWNGTGRNDFGSFTLLSGLGRHLAAVGCSTSNGFPVDCWEFSSCNPTSRFTRSRPVPPWISSIHLVHSSRRSSPKSSASLHWAPEPIDNFPTLLFIPFPF